MHNPRLIVCDEPTSAPDHETGHKVMELLKNVALDDTTQLPVYETAVKQTVHALGVLLEKEPGALLDLLNDEGKVSAAATAIVADLPSDLLRRRPDIRRAERQLAAATAQVGVATADLYPKVNLFAFLGLQNMTLVATEPVQGLGSNSSQVRMAAITATAPSNDKVRVERAEVVADSDADTVMRAFGARMTKDDHTLATDGTS